MKMNEMQLHPMVEGLVNGLHESERPRIGSVIISIYGDVVVPQHDKIELGVIQELSKYLRFESGAVHTALSRLCSDGWFVRTKNGRNVEYSITPENMKTVKEAAKRIYGPNFLPEPIKWNVVVFEKSNNVIPDNVHAINRKTWIVPADFKINECENKSVVLSVMGKVDEIPEWAVRNVVEPAITKEYEKLNELILPMKENIEIIKNLDGVNSIITRVLVIHFWRRIVLRHKPLYQNLMPHNWAGIKCTKAIKEVYHAVMENSQKWWKTYGNNNEQTIHNHIHNTQKEHYINNLQ